MPCSSGKFPRSPGDCRGRHHFRFVQVPFNLGMTEALTLGNQSLRGHHRTVMEAASELDITLIASASLLQGQVAKICLGLWQRRLGWGTTRNARCNS